MRLIMIGPPSAGKGTQAELLSKKLHIPKISTGDILRELQKSKDDLGDKVRWYLKEGLLVPDDIVVEIVRDRLQDEDTKEGFVLDGFPRTLRQAKSLNFFLFDLKRSIDAVIDLELDDDILIERFAGRRVCGVCGTTYHLKKHPPKTANICDLCGEMLIQREDDKMETVRQRIRVYHTVTEPLVDYYEHAGLLIRVDASKDIEALFEDVKEVLRICQSTVGVGDRRYAFRS